MLDSVILEKIASPDDKDVFLALKKYPSSGNFIRKSIGIAASVDSLFGLSKPNKGRTTPNGIFFSVSCSSTITVKNNFRIHREFTLANNRIDAENEAGSRVLLTQHPRPSLISGHDGR